jgi:corrinoid protein of di/trimethylamine methyltransferase
MSTVEKLKQAIMDGNREDAEQLAQAALNENVDLVGMIGELSDGMGIVGKKFETFEVFLPEMIAAADAMMAAMDLITPKLEEQGIDHKKGKVILGAPEGDMHEIGKDIVKTILSGNGYEIVDLGTDVNSLTFIKTAQKEQADVIAISTLMTTTMPGATEVIQILRDQGIRDNFKVVVGGAPTSKEWAEEIGTDGWAEDAFGALNLINGLMKK